MPRNTGIGLAPRLRQRQSGPHRRPAGAEYCEESSVLPSRPDYPALGRQLSSTGDRPVHDRSSAPSRGQKPEHFLAWLDGVVALKVSLPPDPLTIRIELGQDSVAVRRAGAALASLWRLLGRDAAVALKRQLWAQLLKLVYGREVESDALWFQHTFLVIVAKCIALAVLGPREDDPRHLLSGEAFRAAGIGGAVKSVFFDWAVANAEGEDLVRRIMAHVRRFRLAEVENDVLKVQYESLIDRGQRHGLGEYYTPASNAHRASPSLST
jgi:hypothetical protein